MSGHTCLAVPVPALEDWVRERTAHYDPSFVSTDPGFAHAHLTLLAPWVERPTAADLRRVERVLAGVEAFTVGLAAPAVFPDGLVHAVPVPDEPLRALTAALARAFPAYVPYRGRYGDPTPHVTLDRLGPDVTAASVRESLGDALPAQLVVDRVDLQWWGNHACCRMHTWELSRTGIGSVAPA